MKRSSKSIQPHGQHRVCFGRPDWRIKLLRETEDFLSRMLVYEQEFKPRQSLDVNTATQKFFESVANLGARFR